MSNRRARCWAPYAARCLRTLPSLPLPSPTGGWPRSEEKIKKAPGKGPPRLELVENPDILRTIAAERRGRRPQLVIGFAAETQNVIEFAKKKRKAKGADWIVANDVSPETGIMGGDRNTVHRHLRGWRGKLARA